MDLNQIKADVTLDVSSLMCPMPGLKTVQTLRKMPAGQILEVLSSSSIFKKFIPTITKKFGSDVLGMADGDDGYSHLYLKKS